MNQIFIATDFSKTAQHATDYALAMAKEYKASVRMIHCYQIPYVTSENPIALIGVNELREVAEKQLNAEIGRLQPQLANVDFKSHLMVGDILDVVHDLAEDEGKPSLVVLGSSGESDDFFWGSTALRVLRNCKFSVLAVPKEAEWKSVRELCLTSDFVPVKNKNIIEELRYWKSLTGANLHVLHIDKPGTVKPVPAEIEAVLGHLNPSFHSVQHESLEEGVQLYLDEHATDWVIVVPKEYGFFENLFHKSKSKIIAKSSTVPTLAVHAV